MSSQTDEISPSPEGPRPSSHSVSELDRRDQLSPPPSRDRTSSAAVPRLSNKSIPPRRWNFSFRKARPAAEFDPTALADFRVTEWDPSPLVMEIYRTANSHFHRSRLRKEGTLDTLNLGQTRPGLFRRYKTKYLYVSDSTLTCFQGQPADLASATPKLTVNLPMEQDSQLMEGPNGVRRGDLMDHVRWQEGSSVVQVRDRRTQKWLSCRATSEEEAGEWFETIRQEMSNPGFVKNPMTLYFESHPDSLADLVVIVGSTSVRAGFSENKGGGPLIFFPSVVLHNETAAEDSPEFSWGFDALPPSVRKSATSRLSHGFRYSQSLQENVFRPLHLSSLLYYILSHLLRLRDRGRIRLLLSLPHAWKSCTEDVCHVILGELGVSALALVPAPLLSLYQDASSLTALVVRLGGGLEVVPIADGFVLEAAAQRNPELGGHLVDAMLAELLARRGIRSSSIVEGFLWRLVKEKYAFVSLDTDLEQQDASSLEVSVDLSEFGPPNAEHTRFSLGAERWECAEVLFSPALLGKDFPSLPRCVARALEQVDIDLRRPLARNIILVGGTSLLPRLPERLHRELSAILSQQGERRGFQIGIKTLPERDHGPFLGGCQLIRDETFRPVIERAWTHLPDWLKDQEIHV